jgi:hypothetical protein
VGAALAVAAAEDTEEALAAGPLLPNNSHSGRSILRKEHASAAGTGATVAATGALVTVASLDAAGSAAAAAAGRTAGTEEGDGAAVSEVALITRAASWSVCASCTPLVCAPCCHMVCQLSARACR